MLLYDLPTAVLDFASPCPLIDLSEGDSRVQLPQFFLEVLMVHMLQSVEAPIEVQDCPRKILIKDQILACLWELADTELLLNVCMLKVFGCQLILHLNRRRQDGLLDYQENLFINLPPQRYLCLVDEAGQLSLGVLKLECDGPEFDEYDLEILTLQKVLDYLLIDHGPLLGLQSCGRVKFQFFFLRLRFWLAWWV